MSAVDTPVVKRGFSVGGCVVWVLAAIMFVVFVAALLPNIAASYPALSRFAGTAGVTFSTPMAPPQNTRVLPPQDRPTALDGQSGGAGLVPFWGSPEPVEEATPQPTPTPDTGPTLTALAIVSGPTETAAAVQWRGLEADDYRYFNDPYSLETPEPGFVGYVAEQCADPEKVKKSFLLQQMCEDEHHD